MARVVVWSLCTTLITIAVTQIVALIVFNYRTQEMTVDVVLGNIIFPSITALPISLTFFYHRSKLKAAIAALDAANALLQDRSEHDELTGLLHRAAFFDKLSARRRATDVGTFMMVDIDHFKTINDTHGHLVGDQVLKRVAATIAEVVRTGDIVARYGGEEFCIFCVNADSVIGKTVAERVRSSVERLSFAACGVHHSVTISIGIAVCYERSGDSEIALSRADKALYDAKRSGRNRVVVSERVTAAIAPQGGSKA